METDIESDHKIFYSDVNEAMTLKAQHQELSVLISIENDPEEEMLFWSSFFVEPIIKEGFIVVRLNNCQHPDKINLFRQLVNVDSVPSLYYFGPNCVGVTYSWDKFPQPKQFKSYFKPSNAAENAEKKQKIEEIKNSTQETKLNQMKEEDLIIPDYPTQHEEQDPVVAVPAPATAPVQSEIQAPKTIKKARIAAQKDSEIYTEEFAPDQTIGEIRGWIASKFGTNHLIFVVHQSAFLPDDDSMTVSSAGLYPSAKLVISDNSSEIFSNADPENPTIESNDSPQRGLIPRPDIQRGCFTKFIFDLISLFDPWTDYEEKEDFFENKPMYE